MALDSDFVCDVHPGGDDADGHDLLLPFSNSMDDDDDDDATITVGDDLLRLMHAEAKDR